MTQYSRGNLNPAHLPPAPFGGELHLMVTTHWMNGSNAGMLVMTMPPHDGPITLTAEYVMQNCPPPPETDQERRRRLINDAIGTAIRSAGAGLSADTAQSAVDAVMDALDGEWTEDCDLDHEPEL
jgi:hypothetical protein